MRSTLLHWDLVVGRESNDLRTITDIVCGVCTRGLYFLSMRHSIFRSSSHLLCLFAVLTVALVLAACQIPGNSPTATSTPSAFASPGIVAYIGASPVSEAQWQQVRAYAEATLHLLGEPGTELDEAAVLDSFVEDLLIVREADTAEFRISDELVDREEAHILSVAGRSQEELDTVLQEIGLTQVGWRTELHRAVLAATYLEEVILAETPPGQRSQQRTEWLTNLKEAQAIQLIPDFEPLEGLGIGDLAPNFELRTLDGEMLKLSDLRGQIVILNFWATWCHPCQKEIPLFVETYAQHEDDGITVFAINTGEKADIVRDFANDFDMTFPIGLDADEAVMQGYRIFGLPTTFFINRQGVIDYVVAGALRESDYQRLVNTLLQESPSSTP